MNFKVNKTIVLLLGFLLLSSLLPASLAATTQKTNRFQITFKLNNQNLYVSVPPSLYDYFGNMSHQVNGDSDYAKFITPQTVEPIAQIIENLTQGQQNKDEKFADDVLTLVHQIPYLVNSPAYPVETLVNDSGDCVALSLLAHPLWRQEA